MRRINLRRVLPALLSVLLFGTVALLPAEAAVPQPVGITEEMCQPEYWLTGSKELQMTPAEIRQVNDSIKYFGAPEFSHLEDIPQTLSGEWVRELISSTKVPKNTGFVDGKPVSKAYWKLMDFRRGVDQIPDQVEVRLGYSVKRASLRRFPTDRFIGESETDRFFDIMVSSDYLPYQPLAVLHESRDGRWFYVIMPGGYGGWVNRENVALCASREDWLARQNPAEFLVVTGREFQLEEDFYSPELSGLTIPMGTVLPIVHPESKLVNGRIPLGSYVVSLPVRTKDGGIQDELALIPCSADVQEGYLPMTADAVVTQAFKWLGNNYGWAGVQRSQDCSGMVRDIYRCFGLNLPRTSGTQSKTAGLKIVSMEELTPEQRDQVYASLPAGSLLYFSGHITMYLGKDTVISSVGSFRNGAEQPVEYYNTVLLNDTRSTFRRNGKSWRDCFSAAVVFEAA